MPNQMQAATLSERKLMLTLFLKKKRTPTTLAGKLSKMFCFFTLAAVLISCGSGDNSQSYSVGGTVTGLEGSGLVLQNNGEDDLQITENGEFSFNTPVDDGDSYMVNVATHPNDPLQTCTVNNGSGTVDGAAISVSVICSTDSFRVGGTVNGLEGSGLMLQNNAGDDLEITENGEFSFITSVADGALYLVAVVAHPNDPVQTCTVNNGSGKIDGKEVTDVSVICSTNSFLVTAAVSGLEGSGLVLQNNAGDDLEIGANGEFTFATPVASGADYAVTVKTQPSGSPMQSCLIEEPTGMVTNADVTVAVTCGPAYILPTSTTDISLGIKSALVNLDMLYVTTGTEFKAIDVADPLNPSTIGNLAHGYDTSYPWRIEAQAFHNDIVWCVHSWSGGHGQATTVFGVDVSDPSNPVMRGSLRLQGASSLLSSVSLIYSGYWLVHDYSRNLIYIIDISNPDELNVPSSWSVPNMVNGGPGNMMIDGNLLYLPCGENGTLRIYSLENLSSVSQVGSVSLGQEIYGNAVKIGRYVYLSSTNLQVIDVSNPALPVVVKSLPGTGYLKLRNNKLFSFSVDDKRKISVYSLENPLDPLVEDFSQIALPAPLTAIGIYPLSYPSSTWIGDYLVGMTYGNVVEHHGARAMYFPVY